MNSGSIRDGAVAPAAGVLEGTGRETVASEVAVGHLPALDGIRGLAIALVIVFHFLHNRLPDEQVPRWVTSFSSFGWAGVDLFFVLSGYLITGNLIASRGKPGYYKNFYARRSLRIFPLYYAFLVLFLFAVHRGMFNAESAAFLWSHQLYLWLYGMNVLIAVTGRFFLRSINHLWSLAVEEHFYFVWPMVVSVCAPAKLRKIVVWCVLGALALRVALVLYSPNGEASYVLTPCRIDGLAIGAFLVSLTRERGTEALRPHGRNVALACGAALLVMGLVRGSFFKDDPFMRTIGLSLTAIGFGGLLLWGVGTTKDTLLGAVFNGRPLRFFGKYAYGLYIFHLPLLGVVDRRLSLQKLGDAVGSPWLGMMVQAGIATVVTVAVALISYHCYEKHFLKLKRYF